MKKTMKYFMLSVAIVFTLYCSFILLVIYKSNDAQLVNYASAESFAGSRSGIDLFSRLYIECCRKKLGVSPYNDSYLAMVLFSAEQFQGVNLKKYERVLEFALFLIENGQDVNDDSHVGMTLLNYYVIKNNYSIVGFLLENGASPAVRVIREGEYKGMTAYEIANYLQLGGGGYEKIITLLEKQTHKPKSMGSDSTINGVRLD